MLIAPTEPASLKTLLGRDLEQVATSSLPETYGADLLFHAQDKWVGIQRKEFGDFLNSAADGRLQREAMLWPALDVAVLLIEGRPFTNSAGDILGFRDTPTRWTMAAARNLIRSCQQAGAQLEWSVDLDETAKIVTELYHYYAKPAHTTLITRPGPGTDRFYQKISAQNWVLQGFPGIGLERARAILEQFGGLPLYWTVSQEELESVPGIGPKLSKTLWELLEPKNEA